MSDDESEDESPTSRILDQDALRTRDRDRTRLPAGTVLADRYRIVRFISQGGMGAVYEAEDLQLGERVALKTVRAPVAAQTRGLARFKREIQLARKVTHPNVCRIFEFGTHTLPVGQVAFLTMELFDGATLADRIKQSGPLPPGEALSVGRQLAAALAAAHEVGVIHRDLKASNVMLTSGAHGELRAVVSDFGLARGPALPEAPNDAPEEVVGTLAYMAPEQIQGETVTATADVYALGVVFHEMVTGVKPFTGDSVVTAAVQRQLGPRPPRLLAPGLDPLWDTLIQKCLQPDPRQRFDSAREVVQALHGSRDARPRRQLLTIAAAAAVVAALLLGILERPGKPTQAAVVKSRRAVAVLGFKNLSGRADVAWLSTALSEMFTTELAAGNQLRSIAGETVSRSRVELALPDADSLAPDTLARVHRNLGADVVVLGSYLGAMKGPVLQFRLDLRAQDATTGEVIASFSDTGNDADLFALVSKAGAQLRQALGAGSLSSHETAETRSRFSVSPEAQRLYAQGLARLRAFDALGATEPLRRAIAADADFALAHSALSEAWVLLGREAQAGDEARIAFDRSGRLSREERLVIEARFRETSRERDKAVEIWRVLFGFFPDNLEHGLKLATALVAAGKPREATETLAALRELPGAAGHDPRIDLAEASIAQSLGDHQRQRTAAQRAATLAGQTDARLLVASARVLHAYAAGRLGLEDESRSAAREARRLFSEAGDAGGIAFALNREANVDYQQGQLREALRLYREAQAILEKIGYLGTLTAVFNNIAEVQIQQGDLLTAGRMLEQARGFSVESREPRGAAIALLNLTNVTAERGQFAAAGEAYSTALDQIRAVGDQSLVASVMWHRADMLANMGDLAAARAGYEQAAATFSRLSDQRYLAFSLIGLGRIQRELGLPLEARQSHERALRLRGQLRDAAGLAESQIALAQLELDDARAAEALALLQTALPTLSRELIRDREAEAQAMSAQALRELGRDGDARVALTRAGVLIETSQRLPVRVRVGLVQALQAGNVGEARRHTEAMIEEAQSAGYQSLALQCRLVLGQLEIKDGAIGAGLKRLDDLERDARRRGFSRIASAAARSTAR